eukprot:8159878-Alexandrium_andersonii.AAC.1
MGRGKCGHTYHQQRTIAQLCTRSRMRGGGSLCRLSKDIATERRLRHPVPLQPRDHWRRTQSS